MIIKFKHVKIHNFMSFGDAELDLDSSGFTLVSGVNNNKDDMAKSNGSGKSSIWESVAWCLTGETIRGVKSIVNKYTSGGACVELQFNIDNNEYKLTRYKDHKEMGTDLKLFINGEDKSGKGIRDTEKLLAEYLPDLTAQLLGSVIILGQGLPQRFTNNTPAGRKEVLEKLSKSDFMIEDLKERISDRKTNLNSDLRKFEDSILSAESRLGVLNKQLTELKNLKASLVPEDFEGQLAIYRKQLDVLTDNQVDAYNYQLKLSKQVEDKLEEYSNFNKTMQVNYEHEKLVLYETYVQKHDLENRDLSTQVKALENEITRLKNVTDVCPTCGQKLPDVHKVDTTDLENKLTELREKQKQVESTLMNQQNLVEEKSKELKDKFMKDLDKIKEEGKELRELLNSVTADVQGYNAEILETKAQIEKVNLAKENYEERSKTIDADITECEKRISDVSQEILYNNIEKNKINSRLECISKMMTYATRDFRGFLLTGIIDYLNEKAKEYSFCVFDTTNIDFKLEGNNINISYLGKQYEALSGGEKQKIDLIIQFALRDMLTQYLGFSSNVIVLDEIFDNLDEIGCQKVLNLITTKLSDVDSVFIVTHHTDISIPYDKTIYVVKDENGISKVA